MFIQLWALAAASTVLPEIDRAALDRAARAEAARAETAVVSTRAPVGKRFRLDDINEHSAVCRAAGASGDPVGFIQAFGDGYFLSRGEISALAEGCAIYFARAAERRTNR